MNNRKSAAKLLNINIYGEGSTTIPRKGSTLEEILLEKPDTIFKPLFSMFNTKDFKKSGIYCLYTVHNGILYVGRTKSFQLRFRKHRDKLRRNSHHSTWLQRVFNKYGEKNILMFILSYNNTNDDEEFFIRKFNTVKNGYNSTYNTDDIIISEKNIKLNIERTRKPVIAIEIESQKIIEFKSVSDTARYFKTSSSNISRCCLGKIRFIKGYIFKYLNEYDSDKLYSVRPVDYSTRKRICLKCITDNKTFISIRDACNYYNIAHSSITMAIKQKRHCKGLLFKYCEDIV